MHISFRPGLLLRLPAPRVLLGAAAGRWFPGPRPGAVSLGIFHLRFDLHLNLGWERWMDGWVDGWEAWNDGWHGVTGRRVSVEM